MTNSADPDQLAEAIWSEAIWSGSTLHVFSKRKVKYLGRQCKPWSDLANEMPEQGLHFVAVLRQFFDTSTGRKLDLIKV